MLAPGAAARSRSEPVVGDVATDVERVRDGEHRDYRGAGMVRVGRHRAVAADRRCND